MTPSATKITALKKYGSANSRAIYIRTAFDVKYDCCVHIYLLSVRKGIWFHKFVLANLRENVHFVNNCCQYAGYLSVMLGSFDDIALYFIGELYKVV